MAAPPVGSMLRAAAAGRRGMAAAASAIAPVAPGAPLFPRPTGMLARLKGAMGASAKPLPPSYQVDPELLVEVRWGGGRSWMTAWPSAAGGRLGADLPIALVPYGCFGFWERCCF